MKRVLAIIIALLSATLFADTFCWKVSDGDTIWVVDESGKRTKIRMCRIDAPEMNQPYGKEAADRLAELVLGKYVTLESSGKDQYGRSLEVVFVETNATTHATMDVNLQLVAEGLAWQYYTDKTPAYTVSFKNAQMRKIGLWADPDAKNPYHWRKENHPAAPDREYNKRVVPIPRAMLKGQTKRDSGRGNLTSAQDAPETPSVASSAPARIKYRPGGAMPVSSRTEAPVCEAWPETGYWLSTSSNKRHNSDCENYRKTCGYSCPKDEGEPCGKCGG